MKKAAVIVLTGLMCLLAACNKTDSDTVNDRVSAISGNIPIQFEDTKNTAVRAEIIVKDFGSIKIKLFKDAAPKAVENFVTHAKNGYYDNSSFHKIIEDFVIQAGRPGVDEEESEEASEKNISPEGTDKTENIVASESIEGTSIWGEYFEDETDNGLYPFTGALCMANTGKDTNASQFFIVTTSPEKLAEIKRLIEEGRKISLKSYISQAYGIEISEGLLEQFMEYGGAPWLTGHHTVFGQVYEGLEVAIRISEDAVIEGTSTPLENIVIEKIIITEEQGE